MNPNYFIKYPRTHHIEGSKSQPGDEGLKNIAFKNIQNRYLVIEEKMDGANSGISFSDSGELLLQSRGHFLVGGYRERHFNLLKTWAETHKNTLYQLLGKRYIMFGEWLYAKHTIFYNQLPHYFLEFDILDKKNGNFLSTKKRKTLLQNYPIISSVKIIFEGKLNDQKKLTNLINDSFFINNNYLIKLESLAEKLKYDYKKILNETDLSKIMEGLYIKVEENGIVKERYKFIRKSFLTSVIESESHWLDRPIIPNQLKSGVNLFELN
jgi:hypothetical protein